MSHTRADLPSNQHRELAKKKRKEKKTTKQKTQFSIYTKKKKKKKKNEFHVEHLHKKDHCF